MTLAQDLRIIRRFESYFEKGSGCWIWQGALDQDGYPAFQLRTRVTVRAHRFAYKLYVGPIPAGLELDHLKDRPPFCTSRACVNPAHLEPVTTEENVHRARPWAVKADQTHCVHGHLFDETNTHIRKNGTRACRKCHAEREAKRRGVLT